MGLLILDAVVVAEVPEVISEIQNLLGFAWFLSGRSSGVLLYIQRV